MPLVHRHGAKALSKAICRTFGTHTPIQGCQIHIAGRDPLFQRGGTLTARCEAYYSDYRGSARELLACVKHGFLYQGQRSTWQNKKPRGAPALDFEATQRVTFLEKHDQVANSGFGKRLFDLTDRARLRAMTALLRLAPATPMLFRGRSSPLQRRFSISPIIITK